jgi:hypothetical protein
MSATNDKWLWRLLPGLSGLLDEERRRRLLLVMESYIDDSGSGDPPVFLLAGFVARAEEWAILSQRWSEAVHKRAGLEYFKMKEAQALNEQFDGWSARRRNALLSELANIVKDHVLVSVASVVYQRDYGAIIQGNLSKELDDLYWLMYHSTMNLVFQWELSERSIGRGQFYLR